MPAAILLAAGLSTRLGQPKQLLTLEGETLVVRAVRIAVKAGLDPVIAVILNDELIPQLQALGAIPLFNRKTYEGIASSIHVGVSAAQILHADGAVLLTCDQTALTTDHLRALISEPETVTGSAYAGRTGIPAYFPASAFPDLLKLEGDTGARDLLRNARAIPDEALALDIDTESDRRRAGVEMPVKPTGL